MQRRQVRCVRGGADDSRGDAADDDDRNVELLNDAECASLHRPKHERACERASCGGGGGGGGGDGDDDDDDAAAVVSNTRLSSTAAAAVHWATGPWTKCSATSCGVDGMQRRVVECRGHGRTLPAAYCQYVSGDSRR